MRLLARLAARYLAEVELKELRTYRGTTWRLEAIEWSRSVSGPSSLVLTYVLPAEHDLRASDLSPLNPVPWPADG